MKKLFLLLFFVPFIIYAQEDTTANKIKVTEEVNECVNQIYDNPDALKLLMTKLMSDKEKMRSIRMQLMNDPEMKKMMREMRKEMDMHDHMKDDKMMNHHNMDMKKDTTMKKNR